MSKAAADRVVFVVDADASVREGLSRVVESAGLRPKPCDSLEAFLAQAPGDPMACALVDVSGFLPCSPASWSRLQAVAARMPVIALSASDDPATRRVAREFGAQAFFRKPVDAAALLDSIEWVTRAGAQAPG